MGKDNRIVKRAPRIHGKLVKDEDEIAAALSPEQGQRLMDSGALVGSDWQFAGNGDEPELPDEISAAEVAASYISGTFGVERSSDGTAETFVKSVVESGALENEALNSENLRLLAQVETLKAELEKSKTSKAPAK